jgi:Heterokaryon incompatibility protein (HET)
MDNQERYHYTKLTNPDSFRLILLQPSPTLTAPLKCSLLISTLLEYDEDVIDHYTALSYVWGNAIGKRTISIDGKYFLEITATLEQALRYLRDARRELKVWADGICINQNDVEEKNVQVGLMGSIYKLARHTIIFLGEETPESKVVMNAAFPPRAKFVGTPGLLSNLLGMQEEESLELKSAPTLSKEILELAEKHILQKTWFNRVWVLQELVLSADPWIQIGQRRVRWNVFSGRLLSSAKELSTDIQSGVKYLSRMEDARRAFGDSLFRGVKFLLRMNSTPGLLVAIY